MKNVKVLKTKIKTVKTSDKTPEYFDDCAICQAMEKAEKEGKSLGQGELETVFAKQNLKNRLAKKP